MLLLLTYQLAVSAAMFFMVNIMKHWKLLLFPDIFREFDMHLQVADMGLYVVLSYLSFFYGTLLGGLFWNALASRMSAHTSILSSLLFMGLFNYLQAVNADFKTFLVFRFLTGFSMNLEKINKSFAHELFSKRYRQKAFFIESASHTLGTLTGPLFGLLVYQTSARFLTSCLYVSLAVLVVVVLYIFAFVVEKSEKELSAQNSWRASLERVEDEEAEENIPFKRYGTVIVPTWQEALIHAFWMNRISRNLILIFLVNASCFHVSLVLTSNFLTLHSSSKEPTIDEQALALGNLLGGFGSLASIYFLSTLDKDPALYKAYMVTTILVNVLSLLVCPFLKGLILHCPRHTRNYAIYGFFVFKEFVSFYLYSQLLQHLIHISIHKVYRKALNFVLTVLKSLCHGLLFTAVLPCLYFTVDNDLLRRYRPFNYAVSFWLVALLQLSTLFLFKYLELPLDKRSI